MTRNEAIWLAATFVLIEWSNVRQTYSRWSDRIGAWGIRVIPVAFFAFLVFLPWALRDWVVFGNPLPGQAVTNGLSLDGRALGLRVRRIKVRKVTATGGELARR